ncbi:hypothetical protein VTO73DRAFT_9618 [Trametes versicolor]
MQIINNVLLVATLFAAVVIATPNPAEDTYGCIGTLVKLRLMLGKESLAKSRARGNEVLILLRPRSKVRGWNEQASIFRH